MASGGTKQCYYWIAAADRFRDVKSFKRNDSSRKVRRSLSSERRIIGGSGPKKTGRSWPRLPPEISQLYTRSLLILRTLTDNHGGIIAANDSDLLQFGRDTYSYVWPRDGARAAYAFARAGYIDTPRAFFKFCASILTAEGYLLHKYNPDGSFGSSWHPWYAHGQAQLPIQEDGMGLVLWALWQSFAGHHDLESVKELYLSAHRQDGGFS